MFKRILGSTASTLCGWIAGWICLVAIYFFGNQQYRINHFVDAIWGDLGCFLLMGIFIVPTWIIAFAPLYIFIPRKSIMWRWYICVPLGGFAGPTIVQSLFAYSQLCTYHTTFTRALDVAWPLDIPAIVVGSITCLVATLTYDHFNFGKQ